MAKLNLGVHTILRKPYSTGSNTTQFRLQIADLRESVILSFETDDGAPFID